MRRSAITPTRALALSITLGLLAACGAGDIDPEATAAADGAPATPAPPAAEAPLEEPTESEMRALEQARIDAINAGGGLVISMSGATSKPIKVRLTSFRKVGCKPYTRAFRCESEVGWAYPDTELPEEVLPTSRRYTPDGNGGWTTD